MSTGISPFPQCDGGWWPLGKGSQVRLGLTARMPGFAVAPGPPLILLSPTGMVTEAQAVLGKHDRMGRGPLCTVPGLQ